MSTNQLSSADATLIRELFDCGAIVVAPEGEGFHLKFHQMYPDAPLAPMKFHIRTAKVLTYGGGTLSVKALERIGQLLWWELKGFRERYTNLDHIAGIANAGVPLAQEVAQCATGDCVKLHLVETLKIGEGDERHIGPITPAPRSKTKLALFDDLISQGGSKDEALAAAKVAGWSVVCLIVLIDWELGGLDRLSRNGYHVVALFTVTQVIKVLVDAGRITFPQYHRVLRYLKDDYDYRMSGRKA
jgi:orotate phosphoribosyltransferase